MVQHSTADARIGRYRVTAQLSRGRRSRVLLAHRTGARPFSRAVAVKLPTDPSDQEAARALRREATIAARLDHPGVAQVFDLEEWREQPFMVMELVRGVPLADVMAAAEELGERMPPDIALAITRSLADALHHVHEARDANGDPLGIVHRLVHPDNVMIALGGWVKLVDFGAASTAAERAPPPLSTDELTRYAAPELWSRRDSDRRADVYSLGVILRRLMMSSNAALEEDAVPLIERAAALDPIMRFQSAADLSHTIETFAEQRGIGSSNARVAAFLDQLLRRAAEQVRAHEQPSLPGLDRAMEARQRVSETARTRIRLRRRARPIALY